MEYTYNYIICDTNSEESFNYAKRILIERLPDFKSTLLNDVDGTAIFVLETSNREVVLYNDYEVGGVYIDSKIDLSDILYGNVVYERRAG